MVKKSTAKERLIVALDVDSLAGVRKLVEELSPVVDIFKVGSQLFTACGPAVVRFIEAKGKKVFLDLKFHDIPNTVAHAVESAVSLSVALERSSLLRRKQEDKKLGLFMMTVHTVGGLEMMKAAAQAAARTAVKVGVNKPLVVGVTVLTSQVKSDNIHALVLERAFLAKQAGLDGVVASPQEAELLRKELGKDFVIVTPGIRLSGADVGDQKRVATPAAAIKSGSDYLVVGRPIVEAQSPLKAAQDILKEINSGAG